MEKFGANPWKIVNGSGQELTSEYIKVFIMSYCRGDDFAYNRQPNLTMLASDAFLRDFHGKLISEVCAQAKSHPCWLDPEKPVRQTFAKQASKRMPGSTDTIPANKSGDEDIFTPQVFVVSKIHYRLNRGTAWWVGERRSSVGYQVDNWLALAATPLKDVWPMFQDWARKDAKRIQEGGLDLK